jgi:hypothetical protein
LALKCLGGDHDKLKWGFSTASLSFGTYRGFENYHSPIHTFNFSPATDKSPGWQVIRYVVTWVLTMRLNLPSLPRYQAVLV